MTARKIVEKFVKKYGMQDVTFYNKKEWRARREQYGNDAKLILTSEGIFSEHMNMYCGYELHEELQESLLKNGMFMEAINGYSFAIYSI